MGGWRDLVDGFRDAVQAGAAQGERPAPTAPFGDAEDGHPRLPGLGSQDPMVRDVMLARLRRDDPAFDPDAFVRGAVSAFTAIEQAWSELDPQRSRRYLAASLWCSHRARMELYALHGRRNHLDGLTVRGASIVGIESDDGGDRVTVRIAARSTDYDTDGTGAVVRGDRQPFDWREDWVFHRSATATTAASGGVLAQRCPNCGAPLDVDDAGCCTSCHVPVMDGSRDWVAVAVERCDEEQRRLEAVLGVRSTTVPGTSIPSTAVDPIQDAPPEVTAANDPAALAVLGAADPDFVASELCDHARTAFVALRKAWATMDADAARPFLSEPAYLALHQSIADVASHGLHRVTDDPLIGSAVIITASDTDGFLTAVCAVTAELVDADADANNLIVRGSGDLLHRVCELTFRRHDIARSPGTGVSVMRCPRCGAPLRATALEACPYCRQAVADGGGAWALTDIGPLAIPHAAHVAPTPLAHRSGPEAALADLLAVDPTINAFEILADSRETFYALEASTAHGDPSAVEDRLTPAAFATHADRVARLRASGHTVRASFVDITGSSVVAGTLLPGGAMRITVLLDVSGEVDEFDATGSLVAGPGSVIAWSEEWDLVRASPGSKWLVDVMRLPDATRSDPAA